MSLPGKWEFPGGKIEREETAQECIVREIQEELSLKVQIVASGPSTLYPYKPGDWLELIPFVCVCTGGQLFLREHAQVEWCLPEEMADLAWAPADVAILAWWQAHAAQLQGLVKNALDGN
jgi:8-oxo-dGTP diphosphatase